VLLPLSAAIVDRCSCTTSPLLAIQREKAREIQREKNKERKKEREKGWIWGVEKKKREHVLFILSHYFCKRSSQHPASKNRFFLLAAS
jgi:hypothetical protein